MYALCSSGLPNDRWAGIGKYGLDDLDCIIKRHHFHYRMKMLTEKFRQFNSINTPSIRTEWPLLEC